MGTERRHQQRTQPGHAEDRVGTGVEAVTAQHQHARHVLPREGDQKQRQRDAQQRIDRELGACEHRSRELQRQSREVHALLHQQKAKPQHQNADHRVARTQALEQDVGADQHADQ